MCFLAPTEAGLLCIYNFPGSVYATDGSNDKGVEGAGFFKLKEHRGSCCQLGGGEEGNSSNRAELRAACLALEDTKKQQDSTNPRPCSKHMLFSNLYMHSQTRGI